MVKQLSIIVLFLVFPLSIFSQEQEFENFHFIEAGIGASQGQSTHGAFSVALTNSLNGVLANFIDYNLAIDKSGLLFHEFNFKLGPYYRFNRYSYIAVSTGLSFIINLKPGTIYAYDNFYHYNSLQYKEEDFLIGIPIQGKFNIDIHKGCCIGLKCTYNKMLNDTNAKDKTTVLLYLAVGF